MVFLLSCLYVILCRKAAFVAKLIFINSEEEFYEGFVDFLFLYDKILYRVFVRKIQKEMVNYESKENRSENTNFS